MILPLLTVAVLTVSPQQDARGPARSDKTDLVEYRGAAGELDVATPQILGPQLEIDGSLDEEAWSGAALLSGFTQYDPVEGDPASQQTEVLVFVSDDAIYFGIRSYERFPEEIRATVAERD